MQLTGITGKNKNTALNIGIIVLALIISNNIYKKYSREIVSLNIKKDEEIKKNSELEKIVQTQKMVDAYKNSLVKKDPSLIINTISNIAKESGVRIRSIRPDSEQRDVDYIIKSPFTLSVAAANYHDLGRFISKLENYKDMYIVDSVSITSDGGREALSANLKVTSIGFTDQ